LIFLCRNGDDNDKGGKNGRNMSPTSRRPSLLIHLQATTFRTKKKMYMSSNSVASFVAVAAVVVVVAIVVVFIVFFWCKNDTLSCYNKF
jgi:hypothetical protein